MGWTGGRTVGLTAGKGMVARAEDIAANLAQARARQMDQVAGAQLETPFEERLAEALPEPVVGWTFLVSWLAGLALLSLLRFLRPGRRVKVGLAAAALLVVAIPCGLLLAAHAYVQSTVREAVVMSKTLKARESPREMGKVSFEVHAGLKVRLLEDAGKYVKLRLPNGFEGWAEREELSEIEIRE